eukprot:1385033-Rhodomonas_salina.1
MQPSSPGCAPFFSLSAWSSVPGYLNPAPRQILMCAAERRSSLPAVRVSQAASSEGRRSILSHTRGIAAR